MPGVDFTFGMLALLLVMIGLGFHIVVALGAASVLGVWILTGNPDVALSILSTTAFEALRDYVFAVIPLFVLMASSSPGPERPRTCTWRSTGCFAICPRGSPSRPCSATPCSRRWSA